ncbi:MAG: sigma-54-dependent Fis family transcriptional regulator [Gammaproteobacteria bacterium]|nr:sigma-54-dependent Fis family transcriptional regulator [Gammaproteobacteria bacterium]
METNQVNNQQNTILVVEDDFSLREALVDTLELAGYQVEQADNGMSALSMMENHEIGMVITDVQMPKMNGHQLLKQLKRNYPDIPVLLMTAYGTIDKAISAMKDGAIDYLVKPFEPEVLVSTVSRYIGDAMVDATMIAVDQSMQEVSKLALRVADSDATVMITGQSGTGKEVLARFIHHNSERADKPFVAINCAAIPENMLEATLFGYEKGAFTGAYKASAGKFEQANGGTLLLDEISEMDLSLQAKLLRVIQEKEVERLGGQGLIELDVRILATSNRNMMETVKEGKFREDLFYRLNVFPLRIPSLNQRQDDIVPLSQFLLEKISRANAKQIPILSIEAERKLKIHSWPGNIRELENVLQRAFILHMDGIIREEDIAYEQQFAQQMIASSTDTFIANLSDKTHSIEAPVQSDTEKVISDSNIDYQSSETLNQDLKNREYQIIIDILNNASGNRKLTSEKLGISQRTLRYKLAKMRELGFEIPKAYSGVAA